MIDFGKLERRLLAKGYRAETAAAKIAHDVVLKAIKAAGFHDNVTIKGGVAMSGITNVARRATMDMDRDGQYGPRSMSAFIRMNGSSRRILISGSSPTGRE